MKYFVRQIIKDYIQSKTASQTFNTRADLYEKSKATLLGDIHRVKRYFHYKTNTLNDIPYLDPEAVKLAKDEIGSTYDDDGNVLDNIHAYLRTFCLNNIMATADEREQQRLSWSQEQSNLVSINEERRIKAETLKKQRLQAEKDAGSYEFALKILIDEENNVDTQAVELKTEYKRKIDAAKIKLDDMLANLVKDAESYQELRTKMAEDDARIQNLDAFLQLDLAEEHRKLTVKYERGLLLYGPPGTGNHQNLLIK